MSKNEDWALVFGGVQSRDLGVIYSHRRSDSCSTAGIVSLGGPAVGSNLYRWTYLWMEAEGSKSVIIMIKI